jgi:hypothetical protein
VLNGPTFYFTTDNKQISRVEVAGMDRLLGGIDELISSMDHPTDVCNLYLDAVGNGEMDRYIGTQIQLDSSTSDDVSAGAAGARPGSAGARPGSAGARPASQIRPCLSLSREL